MNDGIIDSLNTMRTAIEDAVSVASLIITTEVVVYKEVSYEPPPLDHFKNQYRKDLKTRIETESKMSQSGEKKSQLEELRELTKVI